MPTYIVLGQFTDQGIRNVKETTKRAQALKDMAKKFGATVNAVYGRWVNATSRRSSTHRTTRPSTRCS